MVNKFDKFEDVCKHIDNIYAKENKHILLYAFNATGKTRLSLKYENDDIIESISYNAIVEDYFSWDNDLKILSFIKNTRLLNFIKSEGLEKDIETTFNEFNDKRIETIIDFDAGEIKFETIDEDKQKKQIKISKGEETLFKWSVFYVALRSVIDILNEKEENRSTSDFDSLKYLIIDDPISSLDDYKVYTLSMQILNLIKFVNERQINVKFLITTHHILFYNILYNTMYRKNKKQKKYCFYFLLKQDDQFVIEDINSKHPLVYHLQILKELKRAIERNTIKKYHYNIFRSVLEKMSIVLGYNDWQDMFNNFKEKDKLNKLINMNSHERYDTLETEYLTNEQIEIIKNGFDYFVKEYKIKV